MDSIFPAADRDNRAICIPGVGSTKLFSALVVDTMPDLHCVAFGQCLPRYRYEQPPHGQGELPGIQARLERIDNITDSALRTFRVRYSDNTITKDEIFDYVYGILHASDYRERFANGVAAYPDGSRFSHLRHCWPGTRRTPSRLRDKRRISA